MISSPNGKPPEKPSAKAAPKVPHAKAAAKPAPRVHAKAAAKNNAKPSAKAAPKAHAKAPAKAAPKPKAHAKAPAKPLPKASSKAEPKVSVIPPANTFIIKGPAKQTPAEEQLEKLSFVLANNYLKVLRPSEKEESLKIDNALISKLYRPRDIAYVPQEVTLSHENIIKFIKEVSDNIILSPNMIGAIENIAYRIGSVMFSFKPNEVLQLLKVFARVEPFTVPLLTCFDMGIYKLTQEHTIGSFSAKEIIDLTYCATKVARPITGNIRVALEKLVNLIMSMDVDEIAKLNLLPRVVKILHFMEKCQENYKIDPVYKKNVLEKVKTMLGGVKPESSLPHKVFSERLKKLLASKGIKVEDEFLCEEVGTHLDIAIPQFEIAIEINGSTHYNTDLITENPETKLKRELLEAFGWVVVPVLVDDLICEQRGIIDIRIIDEIIESEIIPLIDIKREKIKSRLAAEANRHFFLCRKVGHNLFEEFRTAKEYLATIEKVEDPQEAERRVADIKQQVLRQAISTEIDDGTILELDLEKVEKDNVSSVIQAYIALISTDGAKAITVTNDKLNLEKVRESQRPLVVHHFNALCDAGGRIRTKAPTSGVSTNPKPT